MLETARLTFCTHPEQCSQSDGTCNLEYDGPAEGADLSPMSVRIVLTAAGEQISFGQRTLNMTLEHLLEQTPMLSADVAEDVLGRWLWGENQQALSLYRKALEQSESIPPRVRVEVCGPAGVRFPDCPVEALLGDPLNPVALARSVRKPENPLSIQVGRHLPPAGAWKVAPISLLARQVLPGKREAAREYDAMARRRLPSIELLDVRYAANLPRLRTHLERIADETVQVLHIIADAEQTGSRLRFSEGVLEARELASCLAEGGYSELQLVVLSAPGSLTGTSDIAWELMEHVPVPAVLVFQGQPSVKTGILPFVENLYSNLAISNPVDVAVMRARNSLRESPQASAADVLAPVLYVRRDETPPAIRPGDATVEAILAAADALAEAQELCEDPAVMPLVSNIPAILSQTHRRLAEISGEQIESIRRARRDELRLIQEEAGRREPTYTFSGAVAEQFMRVLQLPPSPATGSNSTPAEGPDGIDWCRGLRRAQGTSDVRISACPGPRKCMAPAAEPLRAKVSPMDAQEDEFALVITRDRGFEMDEDALGDAAVIDVTRWVPFVSGAYGTAAAGKRFFEQLARNLASAVAQLIRELLMFHFRESLGRADEYSAIPPGLDFDTLLRNGLLGVGVDVEDIPPSHHTERPWPDYTYLLDSPSERAQVLCVLRPSPDGELAGEDADYLRSFCETEYGRGTNLHIIYLDPWAAGGVVRWEPQEPFATSTSPSWIWDQLPRAMSEGRQQMLGRLWEWWIGALPPEENNG